MTQRKMIQGLTHPHPGYTNTEFFNLIDQFGGWPPTYLYVGFVHSLKREVGFTNNPHNDEYWSVLANKDDYHFSRISQQALDNYAKKIVKQLTLIPPINVKPYNEY